MEGVDQRDERFHFPWRLLYAGPVPRGRRRGLRMTPSPDARDLQRRRNEELLRISDQICIEAPSLQSRLPHGSVRVGRVGHRHRVRS